VNESAVHPSAIEPSHANTAPPEADPTRVSVSRWSRGVAFLARYAVLFVLAALLVTATFTNDGFWQIDNLRNILTQNSAVALVSIGMTLVIICGVFDLSVGALFAAGAVFYSLFAGDMALLPAAGLTLLIGAAGGTANGLVITKLNVNAFIGTIGMGAIFSGIVYIACDSAPVQVNGDAFTSLGLAGVSGIPWPVIIAVAFFLIGAFVLAKTVFGRYLYVVGGNEEAARLAGIPVDRVRIAAFAIVAVLSVLAGMITASQLSVGQPTLGATVALDAFAVVVIGGTSVYGGEGALWRTGAGVLAIGVLTNVFNALAWDTTRQSVAKGVVLVAAVALDAMRRSRG
jgi:ribose transport system permease protein